jgi:hypothetical protein
MRKTIDGQVFDTDQAECLFSLACPYPISDSRWHSTAVYRARNQFFLAGFGHSDSLWPDTSGPFLASGEGISLISKAKAAELARAAGLPPARLTQLFGMAAAA